MKPRGRVEEAGTVLIWAKTYPELSWSHGETVCTAGSDAEGTPRRLYPVPLRYLPQMMQYKLWDRVQIRAEPNPSDGRPESLKLTSFDIQIVDHVGTNRGSWEDRRRAVFADRSWHFDCVRELQRQQVRDGTSLGFVKVGSVSDVRLRTRPRQEAREHARKLAMLRSQTRLFGPEQETLDFFPKRVRVTWRCVSDACPGHQHQILDWGLGELGRRDGADRMLARMEDLCDLSEYDLRFFLGNFRRHPTTFGVIGLWYPKHKHRERSGRLF